MENEGEGGCVLICAPFGRDAKSVADLLANHGHDTHICAHIAAIAERLGEGVGAVLLTEEALIGDLSPLNRALDAQPNWSDIPFILLKAQRSTRMPDGVPTQDRLLALMRNIVVLERPLGVASLLSAIASAIRARHKQFQMRDRIVDLAASESRLRLATTAANIGTWDWDIATDVLSWDERCKAMFGLPADAAVSYETAFLAGLHPDDRDMAAKAVEAALDPAGSGQFDVEYRTIGLDDGIERWIAARGGAVFENGQAKRFIGTTINISERKRGEAALAASEAALREESQALETLNRTGQRVAAELDLDALVQAVVDAGRELTGAQIGAFFYNRIDDAGESYLLYSLSGAPMEAFKNFPMPRNTEIFAPTFAGEGPVRSANILKDPRYGRNDTYHGMPKGHLKVVSYLAVPVTSRSGDVIGGLFFGHGEPDMFNARAEHLALGLAAHAATAIENARLMQTAHRLNQTLEQKVKERTEALEQEMANRASAEAALRQSQKMEAVGQLTGGIAHDFNNMLTGVIGGIDIVKRRIASGRIDDLDRFIDAASTSAQRAAALTARLLAFSRRQSLDAKTTDINGLTGAMEDLLLRTINENIRLEIAPCDADVHAIVDPHQLESAILNLAINARDAMPHGGKLIVRVGQVMHETKAVDDQADLAPGRYASIAVIDTGVGMSADIVEKVFEPFFTTKPIGQGTGLGLSMVYGFARQSGGAVRVHSAPGQGTSIEILLPISDDVAENEAGGGSQLIEGEGQSVLVVEDDPSVRLLVCEVLQELGYLAVEASEAAEAIPILKSGRPIDLMVSDVGLPGMTGRQLAEVAREHRPGLPILFVTGYAENAAIRAEFLGTNMGMITKPFALDALADKIHAMISGVVAPATTE